MSLPDDERKPRDVREMLAPTMTQLQSAMNMADLVRSKFEEVDAQDKLKTKQPNDPYKNWQDLKSLPGIKEGLAAGAGVLLLLVPVRSLLQVKTKPGAMIVYTMGQVTLTLNASLYVGMTYGSYTWLNRVASLSPTIASRPATAVCQDPRVAAAASHVEPNDNDNDDNGGAAVWNPNQLVIQEFSKVLRHCQKRNAHEEERKQQFAVAEKLLDETDGNGNATKERRGWFW
eukprot:CAMPEP_0172448822 /NCGR_PEP_ID=MMETSP1065-20121228/7752_1 /TAXON_ID=265537 /ORGANISM="Amphiprora paludosa, Strain CCMP125" /LENGTH=229 /DNA_ID=CAMNT_0013200411 /DNA_START=45 /DNA_END=734 /DNA_ORIENTATION=+